MPTINVSLWLNMSARIDFRAPKKHKEMAKDIARNRGVKDAVIYREAIEQYLSGFSTIPSLKELDRQVQNIQKEVNDIKKALLKKGIIN